MHKTYSMRHFVLITALALTPMAMLTGCQTYVNIPAQTGDVASANINGGNVQAILEEALTGLRGDLLRSGQYRIILPDGAKPDTYRSILATVGDPYTWSNSLDAVQVVDQLEIKAVRVRGLEAAVDIVRSSDPSDADAPRQLVTVYLKRYFVGGWATQQVRVWRLNVVDALLLSQNRSADKRPTIDNPAEETPVQPTVKPTQGEQPKAFSPPASDQ